MLTLVACGQRSFVEVRKDISWTESQSVFTEELWPVEILNIAIYHYSEFDVLHANDKDSLLGNDCNLKETRQKKRDINPDSHYITQSFGQSTVVEIASSFFFFFPHTLLAVSVHVRKIISVTHFISICFSVQLFKKTRRLTNPPHGICNISSLLQIIWQAWK